MTGDAPNILLIQADQMAAPALPFHGHPLVKAPHLAALAEAGVVFDRAYCNAPLCAPSRFSMLAGQLPSAIAAYDNAAEFPAGVPTFAHHLRLMGYRTVVAGKMHFVGPDQLHGFEERLTTDIYPADFGWTPDWEAPEARQDFFHTMASVTEAGPCARSMQIDFDEEVAFHAVRKLYDLARAPVSRPFLMWVSFTHPHDPYAIAAPYWDRYRDDQIDPPAVPALAADRHDPHSRRLLRNYGLEGRSLEPERIRAARHAYYGAIAYVDDKVGELMRALEDTGMRDDTVILFTSDHGDMLGERGLWFKMSFFEWAARVPLVVHAPDRFAPRRVADCVSLVDLFPTLLALAGGAGPEPAEPPAGRSLIPLIHGEAAGRDGLVAAEYLAEGAAGPLVMLRRGRHKYIVGEDSPAQLFDLEDDPNELSNLAGQAGHRAVAARFEAEVSRRWDFALLRRRVILSQRRRRLAHRALMLGAHRAWDYQPHVDAAQVYARNAGPALGALEDAARLPVTGTRRPRQSP